MNGCIIIYFSVSPTDVINSFTNLTILLFQIQNNDDGTIMWELILPTSVAYRSWEKNYENL